ncbi:tRNA 2-selenouridine(34) synthase MnmH [Oceanicoccus sagamiensis]|uniref:tRNA 2-selenouridine synthase n=1 Tax=Oceanicoccus sagamiensis TaxID=716816 RepID=A0A1X9NGQ5_9GAMM|nr:tRNA 2-selenouridine(34) synthase MnmH [Oceanicoccus sagamiensis]ARN76204.1 tRNA 2-selenouridine(34) synthase MnmH [Oceanicoccus sagamiensis]
MAGLTADPATFRDLLLANTPFLDVRAEVEFAAGTLPTSCNVPILNNEERHQVGTCYKQQGQAEAIELGHQLVSGETKQQRIERWCQFVRDNNNAHLYCWRGGMRSNLTQQWMAEAGVDIPLIPGGYKALRRVLLDEIEAASVAPMIIIGGKTGTAKTPLVSELSTGIDLEGFAHHRGSSFGRRVEEPPCQSDFENRLGIDLLKKREAEKNAPLFFEDESRMIGPITLPHNLWLAMCEAPIAVVEMSLEFRIQRILQEYVVEMEQEHLAVDAGQGYENYRQHLLASLYRIRKRLGSQRYQTLEKVMNAALDRQQSSGDVSAHEAWIKTLLVDYYDPMYEYQLQNKQPRIQFSGDYQQVIEWASAALCSG